MKQPDDTEETISPTIERELEALDRSLAGQPVEPDLEDLAELATDLRAERPEPREQWRLEMDVKAGAGFGGSRIRGILKRRPDLRLRSLVLPAGAVATTLVIAAVAITVPGEDDSGVGTSLEPGGVADDSIEIAPGDGGSNGERLQNGDASGGSVNGLVAPESAKPDGRGFSALEELPGGSTGQRSSAADDADRTAPGTIKRRQDRSAVIALKTDTNKVRDVSDQAVQITESSGGVVRSSNLTEERTMAVAVLELSIPTRELDSVLDQLTDLATVKSLNEGQIDITRPFVSAQDRLADARAERTELLKALGNASSDEEVEAIRGQLKDARREISRAEAAFDKVARRARTSQVSLRVEGTPGGDDDGSWSLGDAADDALGALKTVAGVLLIAAAILAPIGILVALIALIALRLRSRRRERALDD